FDLDKGEVFYQSNAVGRIEPVGNGWYRCSMTFTMNEPTTSSTVYFGLIQGRPTQTAAPNYQGDGESYLDLSSPQKELKPFPTSFVDGTRAAGRLMYPPEIINVQEGTFSAWVYVGDGLLQSHAYIFAFRDDTSTLLLLQRTAFGILQAIVGGVRIDSIEFSALPQ